MNKYILISLVLITSLAKAEEIIILDAELKTMLALDLKDLTFVSVASKKDETLDDAPGIVTVITAGEIKRYGARNLRDILDRQTSMQIIGANIFPHNKSSVRGVSTSHLDNTVLILLNGRPLRESSTSTVNHDIYAFFPIASLKQIEIIRGPGSVLYGTNAFAGAINLVTKDASYSPSASLSLSYGSFNTKQAQLNGSGKWGELELFGSIQGINLTGDNHDNITDEFGTTNTYRTGREGEQLILNLRYKGLTLNALQSDTKSDNARFAFTLPGSVHKFNRQFIDLGYRHEINDDWRVEANASYHHHTSATALGPASDVPTGSNGKNYLFELNTTLQPIKKLNLIAGGTYRIVSGKGSFQYETSAISLYTQLDYQLFDWLKVIGGIQYNKPEDITGDLSPRVATIIKLNEHWGSKILFSKAFREASPSARFINRPGVAVGDPSLKPETIQTFDFQIFYNAKNLSFATTYFHSVQKDLITSVPGTPVTVINSGKITYDGFELEGKYRLGHGFDFIGNMSYQTNKNSDGQKDETYAPDWMIKTGVTYDPSKGYQISVFNSYFRKSTLQNHQVATVTTNNPDANGYNLLTANLQVNLGDVFNTAALSNTNFSLYGDNLLDEDIFFPSMRRTVVNSLPHHAGRGFYATINIDF